MRLTNCGRCSTCRKRDLSWHCRSRWRAKALAGVGDNDAAFDAHRQVLALATSTGTLGEELFRLARASRDLGKTDAAVQALRTALDQFPSASTTADALRLLDDLGAANQI